MLPTHSFAIRSAGRRSRALTCSFRSLHQTPNNKTKVPKISTPAEILPTKSSPDTQNVQIRKNSPGRPKKLVDQSELNPFEVALANSVYSKARRRKSGPRSKVKKDNDNVDANLAGGMMHGIAEAVIPKKTRLDSKRTSVDLSGSAGEGHSGDLNALTELVGSKRQKGSSDKQTREPKADKSPLGRLPKRLLDNPWLDISRYLIAGYGGPSRRKPVGDQKRMHVISKSLCDDTLKRLDPTLDQHVGCDIIDINPGTCLWSTAIHERLKPRSHILLEPDEKLYRPFLNPILNAPGSVYRLYPKSGITWAHLETILSKDYLPFQEQYQDGDPRLEEKNDSLLVIANLGYHPKKSYRGFDSVTTLVLYQFLSAMRSHSLFEKYGRVRVLVWAADEEKRKLLPRNVWQRRKTSIEAEVSCERVQEIVSSTEDCSVIRREDFMDLEVGRQVASRMKAAGIETPPGRESVLLARLAQEEQDNGSLSRQVHVNFKAAAELEKLEADFAAGKFKRNLDITLDSTSSKDPTAKQTPEWLRLTALRIRKKVRQSKTGRGAEAKIQHDRLMELQSELHSLKSANLDHKEVEREFLKQLGIWKEKLESMPDMQSHELLKYIEDHRAISSEPPLLLFDRREFEPLRALPHEFFPNQQMCLLDIQPKALWPILKKDFQQNYDILEYIIGNIFIVPTQSLKNAFQSLYPGAYEWIVAECPTLTDPSKGGALDLESLSVRCITLPMLEEILEAWAKWPFRPNRSELLGRLGALGSQEDTEDSLD